MNGCMAYAPLLFTGNIRHEAHTHTCARLSSSGRIHIRTRYIPSVGSSYNVVCMQIMNLISQKYIEFYSVCVCMCVCCVATDWHIRVVAIRICANVH